MPKKKNTLFLITGPPMLKPDRKSTRLNSSHANIYPLSLHDALPIWHRGEAHRRRCVVDGVIDAEEEEHLVLDYRAADVEAKIVEVLRRLEGNAVKDKRRGIQRGVLEVVVRHAVELIGAALADLVINHAAASVLRGEG